MLKLENQSGFGLPSDLYKMLPVLKSCFWGPMLSTVLSFYSVFITVLILDLCGFKDYLILILSGSLLDLHVGDRDYQIMALVDRPLLTV